jgi:hypothetical protein
VTADDEMPPVLYSEKACPHDPKEHRTQRLEQVSLVVRFCRLCHVKIGVTSLVDGTPVLVALDSREAG